MRIAVCDDSQHELLRLVSLVEAYRRERKADLHYFCFQSATELLASMHGDQYDVLLLDILMPGLSGLQAAREVRNSNSQVEIVFLTTSPEYAVESYSVRAYHYLLKPASPEKLFPILDRLRDNLRRPEEALRIKTQSSVFSLPFGKIECLEVNAKRLYFCLTDGSSRQVPGTLAEFEPALLTKPGFVKVHRSYLVNLQWVQELRPGELITVSGRRVPISRAAYAQVRTAYTQFLFQEAEDLLPASAGAGE